jgi:hypothetical protein
MYMEQNYVSSPDMLWMTLTVDGCKARDDKYRMDLESSALHLTNVSTLIYRTLYNAIVHEAKCRQRYVMYFIAYFSRRQ